MRVVFLGTGAFAVPSLRGLVAAGHEIAAVVCQPDRPQGRGLQASSSPVKLAAGALGLPILQPERIKAPGCDDELRRLRPDVQVVVAYGQILPRRIIDIAPLGTVNVHGSVLPRWRGAAPIQWAIASGDEATGVTTMLIDEGLDTGPILDVIETPIAPDERAPDLEGRLSHLGATLLCRSLDGLHSGLLVPSPQNAAFATHARPLEKRDGSIDWRLPARQILCRMRGFSAWPGAFTTFQGKTLKVLRAREAPSAEGPPGTVALAGRDGILVCCGDASAVLIEEVQPESRRPMPAHAFAAGARLTTGTAFSLG